MRIKKFLTGLLAVVLSLPLGLATSPTVSQAQVVLPESFSNAQGVGGTIGAVSTDVGILIKYVGGGTGGTVAVDAATGDLTLSTGPVGGSAVDTTLECPLSGAFAGVIDTSNAACNTLGEVVDIINGSANWRAVIVDGVRSDSSDNTLITLAETAANTAKGVGLLKDTTVALNVSLALMPFDRLDIRNYLSGEGTTSKFTPNPVADNRAVVFFVSGTFTGTGADTHEVISILPNLQRCTNGAAANVCSASETNTTIKSTPGGTTTVNKEYKDLVYGKKGEKLLVRLKAATTFTAAFLSANGIIYEFKGQ